VSVGTGNGVRGGTVGNGVRGTVGNGVRYRFLVRVPFSCFFCGQTARRCPGNGGKWYLTPFPPDTVSARFRPLTPFPPPDTVSAPRWVSRQLRFRRSNPLSEIRQEIEKALIEKARKTPKRQPIPTYQKIIFFLFALMALVAFVAGVFFR